MPRRASGRGSGACRRRCATRSRSSGSVSSRTPSRSSSAVPCPIQVIWAIGGRVCSSPVLQRALVGVAALAIDAALGEPPARLHPVVGMGSLLSAARRRWRAHGPAGELAEGAAGLAAVVAASALGAMALQRALARLPRGAALLGEAGALSTLLALRGLREAVAGRARGARRGRRGRGTRSGGP